VLKKIWSYRKKRHGVSGNKIASNFFMLFVAIAFLIRITASLFTSVAMYYIQFAEFFLVHSELISFVFIFHINSPYPLCRELHTHFFA
jgi:hypothetical protein